MDTAARGPALSPRLLVLAACGIVACHNAGRLCNTGCTGDGRCGNYRAALAIRRHHTDQAAD